MSLLIILIIITSAILYICTVYIILNWFCFKLCSVSFSFLKGVFVHVRSVSAHEEIYIECACINYSCSDLMKPLWFIGLYIRMHVHYLLITDRRPSGISPPQAHQRNFLHNLSSLRCIYRRAAQFMKFEQRDGCK